MIWKFEPTGALFFFCFSSNVCGNVTSVYLFYQANTLNNCHNFYKNGYADTVGVFSQLFVIFFEVCFSFFPGVGSWTDILENRLVPTSLSSSKLASGGECYFLLTSTVVVVLLCLRDIKNNNDF